MKPTQPLFEKYHGILAGCAGSIKVRRISDNLPLCTHEIRIGGDVPPLPLMPSKRIQHQQQQQ